MIEGHGHLGGVGSLPTPMFATIRVLEEMTAPMTAMTMSHFAEIEKMTAPVTAMTMSHFAEIEKMTASMIEMTNPMADVIARSIRAVEPVRLFEPMRLFEPVRLFEQLRVFETPTLTYISALDLAASRALEWRPLLDDDSEPIRGLTLLLSDKRNKIASARLAGAYIQLLLYARARFGKSPGKLIASSPRVTRGPDTRSSTFASTAGLVNV
jgi:hypothetical protein